MLIADWYNKTWVRAKRERSTLVVQRFRKVRLELHEALAYHPVLEDETQIQTIEEMARRTS